MSEYNFQRSLRDLAQATPLKLGILVYFLSLILQYDAWSAGVLAYRGRDQRLNSSPIVVLYRDLRETSGGQITVATHDKTFQIERVQYVGNIEILLSLPSNIIEETDVLRLRTQIERYRDFIARFNRSKPLLEGFIDDLQSMVASFEAGRVKYKGEWMAKERMLALKQIDDGIRNEEKEKSEIAAREKLLFEETQKAKGLSWFGGRWIPQEEARSLFDKQKINSEIARKKDESLTSFGRIAVLHDWKVLQVLEHGALACLDGTDGIHLCLLIGLPENIRLIDGSRFAGFFADNGEYQYQDTRGALRTVPKRIFVGRRYLSMTQKIQIRDSLGPKLE